MQLNSCPVHFTGAILLDEAMQETLDEHLQPVQHFAGRTPGNPHISVLPTIEMDFSGACNAQIIVLFILC